MTCRSASLLGVYICTGVQLVKYMYIYLQVTFGHLNFFSCSRLQLPRSVWLSRLHCLRSSDLPIDASMEALLCYHHATLSHIPRRRSCISQYICRHSSVHGLMYTDMLQGLLVICLDRGEEVTQGHFHIIEIATIAKRNELRTSAQPSIMTSASRTTNDTVQ